MLVRMTCIYEPDDLTETRMELLAAVSTDSDLYLAKVGHHDVLDLFQDFLKALNLNGLCIGVGINTRQDNDRVLMRTRLLTM